MNKAILLVFILLQNAGCFAQDKDLNKEIMVGVYASGGWNKPVRLTTKYITEETSPWYGYESYSAGIKVSMIVFEKSGIEIAACFSKHKFGFELSPPIYFEKKIYTETFRIISIPITYKRNFQNNFFFDAGTIIDFKRKNEPVWIDTQSGFGISIGIGRNVVLSNYTIEITPNLEIHSLIPFNSIANQQRLFVLGFKIELNNNCP